MLTQIIDGTLIVRLFQNDIIPGPASVLSDFQPCTFPDYVDQQLQPGMATPTINPVGQAQSVSDVITWTRGAGLGSQTAYGYVVFHQPAVGPPIFGVERFTQPRVFTTEGQSLTLQVQMLLSSTL